VDGTRQTRKQSFTIKIAVFALFLNIQMLDFYATAMPESVQMQIFLFNASCILKAFTALK
jgi:hypothetical protein